jgi:hypothetical protein
MCNQIIKTPNAAFLDEKRRSRSMRIHIPTIYSIITCQTATALTCRADKTLILSDCRASVNASVLHACDAASAKGREEYTVDHAISSGC